MKADDEWRILSEADRYARAQNGGSPGSGIMQQSFKAGAEYERPISYNQGWNEAIEHIKKEIQLGWYNAPAGYIAEEIQKLKKP